MKIRDIKGLKYPDEFITRFFFKENLNQISGEVIEFGCGNGNNLMLFYEYGWNVTGLDINHEKISYANNNFSIIAEKNKYSFIEHDIRNGLPDVVKREYNAVLFPNILNYISRESVIFLLKEVRKFVKNGAYIFLKTRSIKDYRYGKGKMVERNGFILDIKETGEYGSLNVFYFEYELIDMLREFLNLDAKSMQIFHIDFMNVQQGVTISNSDIVVWGRTILG